GFNCRQLRNIRQELERDRRATWDVGCCGNVGWTDWWDRCLCGAHIERQEGRKDMIQDGLLPFEGGKRQSGETPARKLLEVRDLQTKFYTVDGVVNALNGVSYSVDKGECLAIVGESGSGKTVGVLSILRLIQSPPGRIVGGSIFFKGTDLLTLGDRALRDIRGGAIAVLFQDPVTSLNPHMRIGAQTRETIMEHERLPHRRARAKAVELLAL